VLKVDIRRKKNHLENLSRRSPSASTKGIFYLRMKISLIADSSSTSVKDGGVRGTFFNEE
jgi:hypothetical protein